MRTTLAFLAVACVAITAAPQDVVDSPGVTVSLNGATLLHRTPVSYPPEAVRGGVQGTVSVQVKLDSSGEVSDAQVLSGPEELRKPAIASVLQWHFSQDVAGSTRSIQIAFELPKGVAAASATPPPPVQEGVVRSIHIAGLSEEATAQLQASLPIHEGDTYNAETAQRANQAVRSFDEHLTIRTTSVSQSPGGPPQLDLTISSSPGRIKVGGAVIAASILTKVPPVYPAAAKAARVSGVVHLAVIIGTDGTMQQIHALSGPPELVDAAMDAVKQWVYKPTLLNGNPVQVETTIDINFTLSQ
jgi:TonB family protein